MTDARPPSEPTGASFGSVSGSLTAIGVITTRSIRVSSILEIAPSGVTSAGNCATVSCSAMILEPTGIATFATTTSLVRLKVWAVSRYCLTETAAIRPKVTAANKAMIKRLFRMMIYLHFVKNCGVLTHEQGRCDQAAEHDGDAVRNSVFVIAWYREPRHFPAGHDADKDPQYAV